jgi:hypothetical protein
MALCVLRLNPRFRFALYAAFSVLFLTGCGWLLADRIKDGSLNSEAWQAIAANLLMLHGGAAMATLMLLGALFPLHIQRAWRSGRNRSTALGMLTFNSLLVLTSFGLYYAGADILRAWASSVHEAIGLGLPVLFLIHVLAGRRGL